MTEDNIQTSYQSGKDVRAAARSGALRAPTAGLAPGYVQANLMILPEADAFDFLRFCIRNPKPCPLLEVTAPGAPHPDKFWAVGADLRTDLPRYCVFQEHELIGEVYELMPWWRSDLVGFLLGCSFTFDSVLELAGIPVRHQECGCNVPMYCTTIQCRSAGKFQGPLVVSMRPIPRRFINVAIEITSRYPLFHGAPVHVGDPGELGIVDLDQPDYGDSVPFGPEEVPVFWACGVTSQVVALKAGLDLMITHAPGHMFVTDRTNKQEAN